MTTFTRRETIYALANGSYLAAPATGVTNTVAPADADELPIQDPEFNVRTLGRLQGNLSGRRVFAYRQGRVFGLVPSDGPSLGEYGRLMYLTEGCTIRSARLRNDGAIEERTRNWLFYKDAQTHAYIDSYLNPYSGERVPVPTFRAGITGGAIGVRGPELTADFPMESTVFDKPMLLDWNFVGDRAWIYRHSFTRWKESSSSTFRTEMTLDCWVCRIADVADRGLGHIPNTYSWTSQTQWQTWLKMKNHEGAMLWRHDGIVVDAVDALPTEFVSRTNVLMPNYFELPL